MMILSRGLEYIVNFKEDYDFYDILAKYIKTFKKQPIWKSGQITIACTDDTDNRLINTKYYKDNQHRWFNCNPGKHPVDIQDISLTASEQEYLDFVLDHFDNNVILSHGWYDVTIYR